MTTVVVTGDELATLAIVAGSAPFPGVGAPTFAAVAPSQHQDLVAGFGLTLLERGLLLVAPGDTSVTPGPQLKVAMEALTGLERWVSIEQVTPAGPTISSVYSSASAAVCDQVTGPFHHLTDLEPNEAPAWLAQLCRADQVEAPPVGAGPPPGTACSRGAIRGAVTRLATPGGARPSGHLELWLATMSDSWRASTTLRLVDLAPSGTIELAWFTILDAGAAGCWRIEPDGDQELASLDAFDDDRTACRIHPVEPAGLAAWLEAWCRRDPS